MCKAEVRRLLSGNTHRSERSQNVSIESRRDRCKAVTELRGQREERDGRYGTKGGGQGRARRSEDNVVKMVDDSVMPKSKD
jgi:hypothetical protein